MDIVVGMIMAAIIVVGWVLPFMLITTSRQTGRPEKVLWVCALLFLSWFCWVIYLLVAPLKPIHEEDWEGK
ncbi:hypothetical protein [Vibrio owensii]|uniref:hypothetical protein n=1 Tax=Vibrio owensii TaxID=696485 RepID=UPI00069387C3|nr:hypothetical protein [Vibrio owensii]